MFAELMTTGVGSARTATADYAERKGKLADLKIKEADLMSTLADLNREVAEKEKKCAAVEGEVARLRSQMDQLAWGNVQNGQNGVHNGQNGPNGVRNGVKDIVAPGLGYRQAAVVEGPIATLKKSPGRPKREQIEAMGGNPSQVSLPNVIEIWLKSAGKDGMALAEMVEKLHELIKAGGYTSMSDKPRSMLDQAIFRLKKRQRIIRNNENMKFFHADFAQQAE